MPIPTAEENALSLIVEDAAIALAESEQSPVFRPGYDDMAGQLARDAYRRHAMTVINVSRAQIEAPLITRYRDEIRQIQSTAEAADARLAVAERALRDIQRMVGAFDTPRDAGRVQAFVGDVGQVVARGLGEGNRG